MAIKKEKGKSGESGSLRGGVIAKVTLTFEDALGNRGR